MREDAGRPEKDWDHGETEPTPAERLLYALGQAYRRWYRGELAQRPHDFDVVGLARTIGVSRDIQLVTAESYATVYHFADEVLVALAGERFPWVIWSVEHWGVYAELEDFMTRFDLD